MAGYSLFSLQGTAKALYDAAAKDAPIYDYHCHLSPKEIAEDAPFTDIGEMLLGGDHYKWRAMRYAGVEEAYVTGNAPWREKFKMWAKTCEKLVGCPLYAWSRMEMKLFFDVDEPLSEKNADDLYHLCNLRLMQTKLSPSKILRMMKVKLICTTDNPADDLAYHKRIAAEGKLPCAVLPTFRPDQLLKIRAEGFCDEVAKLGAVSGRPIEDYSALLAALESRVEFFAQAGCRLSDHSLETLLETDADFGEVSDLFEARLHGEALRELEENKYRNFTLKKLAGMYCARGFAMQLHIGALRNVNTAKLQALGPDMGYDIPNDFDTVRPLAHLLDSMEEAGCLPKTILYTLNAKDNLPFSTLPICFSQPGCAGKVQFGVAWWHNDHKDGMIEQLKAVAVAGALPYFVGMLTDSRSFLSYARHDYFRRILCCLLADYADCGDFAGDPALLEQIVRGVCYENIRDYLELEETK